MKVCSAILLGILALATGCMTSPVRREKGLVSNYYSSLISTGRIQLSGSSARIRVSTVRSAPAARSPDSGSAVAGATALALLPGLSLLFPTITEQNTATGETSDLGIGSDELEKILVEELRRSAVVDKVELGGKPLDLDLRGQVNFTRQLRYRSYGLGLLAGFAWVASLPIMSENGKCEAYFELVSPQDGRVVFQKDYVSTRQWNMTCYDNLDMTLMPGLYGRLLFPEVVRDLVSDLKAALRSQPAAERSGL